MEPLFAETPTTRGCIDPDNPRLHRSRPLHMSPMPETQVIGDVGAVMPTSTSLWVTPHGSVWPVEVPISTTLPEL